MGDGKASEVPVYLWDLDKQGTVGMVPELSACSKGWGGGCCCNDTTMEKHGKSPGTLSKGVEDPVLLALICGPLHSSTQSWVLTHTGKEAHVGLCPIRQHGSKDECTGTDFSWSQRCADNVHWASRGRVS